MRVPPGCHSAAVLCQPGEREGAPPPRVLVPGAGLGRLCLDIARLGFHTEVGLPTHRSSASSYASAVLCGHPRDFVSSSEGAAQRLQ